MRPSPKAQFASAWKLDSGSRHARGTAMPLYRAAVGKEARLICSVVLALGRRFRLRSGDADRNAKSRLIGQFLDGARVPPLQTTSWQTATKGYAESVSPGSSLPRNNNLSRSSFLRRISHLPSINVRRRWPRFRICLGPHSSLAATSISECEPSE